MTGLTKVALFLKREGSLEEHICEDITIISTKSREIQFLGLF